MTLCHDLPLGDSGKLRDSKLWSLWEIMETVPSGMLLSLYATTGVHYPSFIGPQAEDDHEWNPNNRISVEDRKEFARLYRDIRSGCELLELGSVVATIDKMISVARTQGTTYGDFFGLGHELAERLKDELKQRVVLTLTLKEATFYKTPLKDWEDIGAAFPDSVGDIEEAHKCFALSRYAAAVFHSLQVVECGLIVLGNKIGSKDPLPGWGATTNALARILAKKHPDRSGFEQQHSAFFEQISATIEGLKNAWRNKVSHAHGKLVLLTADFSPKVAEEILFATRAFMRRLATEGPMALPEPPA